MSAEDKSQERDHREGESNEASPQGSEQDNESLPADPVDLTETPTSDEEVIELPADVAIKGKDGGDSESSDSGGETRHGDRQSEEPESSGEDKD